jgi:hypothetical protein
LVRKLKRKKLFKKMGGMTMAKYIFQLRRGWKDDTTGQND